MRRVDGHLSRRAQQKWPGALVYECEDGAWVLERPGRENLGLGDSFHSAQMAIVVLVRAEEQGTVGQ